MTDTADADTIETVRAFNRFYTNTLGVLDKAFLGCPYTLTEARILYELGAHDGLTAASLTRDLHIDPAYLSRILKKFKAGGLIENRPDPQDLRSQILVVTARGQEQCDELARRSRSQIADRFLSVPPAGQVRVVQAMRTIRAVLDPQADPAGPAIIRPHRAGDIGWIVQSQSAFYTREYGWNHKFEALAAEITGAFLLNFDPERENCWIAERDGMNIGSVMIANGGDGVAKLRLLYIDAAARGLGLGRVLVEDCIRFSKNAGYRQLSLWTNDILETARRIYQKAGFRLVAEEKHRMFGPELNGQTWVLDL